ncbi:MAG: PAS domain S-box protein [Atribacterota bacterium]|nr:PAS domain S-box protein [Atribacterota bacterium]
MKKFDKKELNKIIILGLLLFLCFFLTYYFHFILKTEVVFTHLFYVPIALAGLWWARKGIIVAVLPAVVLPISHILSPLETPLFAELVRALMFILVGISVGILSEKKRILEEKLRVRSEALFENSGTATLVIEEDMTASMVNSQCEKLTGYSKKEIENKMKWTDFVIPEDLERMKKYHINRRKTGEKPPTEYEFCMMDKKGKVKNIFLKIGMIPNTKKSIASLTDITKHKQAEERIKHLNLVLRAIRNVNQLIIKEKDRDRLLKGTCDSLTKTRGYYNSWIVLLDEEGKIDTYAETGLGKDFLPIVKLLKEGKLTVYGQKALKQKDIMIIEDPASTCTDCPLVKECSERGGTMTIRLEHIGKIYGIMSVSIPTHFINDKEEQALFKEVAGDIALGLYSIELGEKVNKQTHDLKERVKEFSCLFKLSQLIEKPDVSLEEIIQELVNFLPSAWQYPEITCARIILGNKIFKTENFKETAWKQIGNIRINKKTIGTLEIYYLEERPENDEGPFQKEERDLMTIIAARLGRFIDRKESKLQLQQSYRKLKKAMDATIETMSKIVEAKDPYTSGHQQRVSQLATSIAKELSFSKDKVEGIRIASLIHDIGKIGLPTEILSKPTKLSDIEFNLIKEHSQIGYDILQSIDFSYPVARIVLQHHERLDGSGYPNHLKGDQILLGARVIGVADVVEAMSSHRPYRPALGIEKAMEETSQNRGIFYDSKVVNACLKLFKEKGFKFE